MNPPWFSLARAVAGALRRSAPAKREWVSKRSSLVRAHPPIPPRGVRSSDAPGLARARALERALKRPGESGSYLAEDARRGRGNGSQPKQTLLRLSDFSTTLVHIASYAATAPAAPTRRRLGLAQDAPRWPTGERGGLGRITGAGGRFRRDVGQRAAFPVERQRNATFGQPEKEFA